MRNVHVNYRSAEEFLESLDTTHGGIQLLCPTTTPCQANERLMLELHFPELPNHVVVRGQVLSWRTANRRGGVRAAALVQVEPSHEDEITFLQEVARGERKAEKQNTRIPTEIPVTYRKLDSTKFEQAALLDISVDQVTINLTSPLAVGDEVILEILSPGAAVPIELAGRVSDLVETFAAVTFVVRNPGGHRQLTELVRRFRSGQD